jgi:hypothetical protein
MNDVSELDAHAPDESGFAANASHELRTPLAAIRAAVETMATIELARTRLGVQFSRLDPTAAPGALVADLLDLSLLEQPTATFRANAALKLKGSCARASAFRRSPDGQRLNCVATWRSRPTPYKPAVSCAPDSRHLVDKRSSYRRRRKQRDHVPPGDGGIAVTSRTPDAHPAGRAHACSSGSTRSTGPHRNHARTAWGFPSSGTRQRMGGRSS